MNTHNKAKSALDSLIKKSRVHLYKPIQIAEILFHHRLNKNFDLNDLESYRNISKKWRDEVSTLLVGRRSTSSQKFQDNLFESNAMPPTLLAELGIINEINNGMVEAYIYRALEERLKSVRNVEQYIKMSTPESFSLIDLVSKFKTEPGLRRSTDKIYEILVYGLFSTIVRALNAKITLEICNPDPKIIKDFEKFISMVLGIDSTDTKQTMPAALYRVGVTNAADRGLDIWSNFGPAVQVKHLTLTPELIEDIVDEIAADKIVIVCLDAEKTPIESLLTQVGWASRIQGIITISDLDEWYKICLSQIYKSSLGSTLLIDLQREFENEFPSGKEIKPFISKRDYDKVTFIHEWVAR